MGRFIAQVGVTLDPRADFGLVTLSSYYLIMDLSVTLGRLNLRNPVLVASGTFGYAREMAGIIDFGQLGGIIPKTVTRQSRAGSPPPRTVETPSGLLNSIGLDNDGIDY